MGISSAWNFPSRTAQAQSQGGKAVDRADLQPGDLVFFGSSTSRITHVGIYVGNGQMVHSPQTGDVVKVSSLNRNYVCARRLFIEKGVCPFLFYNFLKIALK